METSEKQKPDSATAIDSKPDIADGGKTMVDGEKPAVKPEGMVT